MKNPRICVQNRSEKQNFIKFQKKNEKCGHILENIL